ncbi:MAG: ribonuclease III [Acidimicrobiia bacterium]
MAERRGGGPFEDVEEALGYRFRDAGLLRQALIHRSYVSEHPDEDSNERLEFLGDAILSLVVTHHLFAFTAATELREGEMAKVRAGVVNEPSLARCASAIGLGPALLLGKGEEESGGRVKASILADALEAVLGAVYLDGGLDPARGVILRHWRSLIAERAAEPGRRDYKTRLQEAFAPGGLRPVYEISAEGPDHQRRFTARVLVEGRELGRGEGTSKKRAEQAAAQEALEAVDEAR